MKNIKQKHMSDSFYLGLLLALVGGFLDAYTYVLRGKVFANAQTGNIVLLGLAIADGKIGHALSYLIPILSFILGIILSDMVEKNYKENNRLHWRQITILVELFVLLIVGFIPLGDLNMLANVLISFVCSIQVESFRRMNHLAYASTMCTGNLRSGTEQLYKYIITKDVEARNKFLQYYTVIILFIIGAVVGMEFSKYLGAQAIWLCCVMLAIIFLLMIEKDIEWEK